MTNDDQMMTAEQVATYLRITPRTVRRMHARGDLPGIRLGRLYLCSANVLSEWMNAPAPATRPASSSASPSRPSLRMVGEPVTAV